MRPVPFHSLARVLGLSWSAVQVPMSQAAPPARRSGSAQLHYSVGRPADGQVRVLVSVPLSNEEQPRESPTDQQHQQIMVHPLLG